MTTEMRDDKKTGNDPENPRLGVDRNCLGAAIHTNLRKFCDSKPTSLVYNIATISNKGWDAYLDLVWAGLQNVRTPQGAVTILKEAADALDWEDAERNALRLAFDFCDDDDFRGMISYLLLDYEGNPIP